MNIRLYWGFGGRRFYVFLDAARNRWDLIENRACAQVFLGGRDIVAVVHAVQQFADHARIEVEVEDLAQAGSCEECENSQDKQPHEHYAGVPLSERPI